MLNLARLVSRPLTCLRSATPILPSSSSCPCVYFSSFGQSRSLPSPSPSTNCSSSSSPLLLQAASPLLVQSCGIKHMGKLQKRCRHCYFAVKDEQKYVMCTANPRWFKTERLYCSRCAIPHFNLKPINLWPRVNAMPFIWSLGTKIHPCYTVYNIWHMQALCCSEAGWAQMGKYDHDSRYTGEISDSKAKALYLRFDDRFWTYQVN